MIIPPWNARRRNWRLENGWRQARAREGSPGRISENGTSRG
jgi:hypothetical protein